MCMLMSRCVPAGLGQTHPDPSKDITLPDGVVVPQGKGVNSNITHSSLLYNEYPYYLDHHLYGWVFNFAE